MCDLTNPIFTDEDQARKHLENLRWPNGPVCPHCGESEKITQLKGKSHRPGLYVCKGCQPRQHFTVTVGTVMEDSHIKLHKWLLAFHLMASSKKGISSHQLHRMLGITYKSAWFMTHRIREAMKADWTKSVPLKFSNEDQSKPFAKTCDGIACAWFLDTGLCAVVQTASSLFMIQEKLERLKVNYSGQH